MQNGTAGSTLGGSAAMPSTMPSRTEVTTEPVTDPDQLPIHPDDRHGYVAAERDLAVAEAVEAARPSRRRPRGVEPSPVLARAIRRRLDASMFPVLTPGDVAAMAADLDGKGEMGVRA